MNIKQKLTVGGLLLGFVPVLIAALVLSWTTSNNGNRLLRNEAEQRLTTLRETTFQGVERYFDVARQQAIALSTDQLAMEAFYDLQRTFFTHASELDVDATDQRASVSSYYDNDFSQRFQQLNSQAFTGLNSLTSTQSEETVALQYSYISNNNNPLGEKDALTIAPDFTGYTAAHTFYHDHLRAFLKTFALYDVFLIDPETGYIVYSVFKEIDFATSLQNGPFANSGIGEAYRGALGLGKGEVYISDLAPYLPSYNLPAMFVATPMYDGDELISIAIIQLAPESLQQIVTHNQSWATIGLGQTGETYLVGTDSIMRSNSRQFLEDPTSYLNNYQRAGASELAIAQISASETTQGIVKLDTPAVEAAMNHSQGFLEWTNEEGFAILSAYRTLQLGSSTWVLIAEIQTKEAFAAVRELQQAIQRNTVWIIVITLIVSGITGVVFATNIIKPVRSTVSTLRNIAEGDGDLTQRLNEQRNDEMGELAAEFNRFIGNVQTIVEQAVFTSGHIDQQLSALLDLNAQTGKSMLQQKGQTDQIATAFTELAANAQEIAHSMEQASKAAQSANDLGTEAQDSSHKTLNSMHQLTDSVSSSANSLQQLNDDVNSISQVLSAIQSIAEQTNLLALNAAIEAARAGDQGRGFAVVADEVRALAAKTQSSTELIQTTLGRLTQTTAEALKQMDFSQQRSAEAGNNTEALATALNTIIEQLNTIHELNNQVAQATEQQSSVTQDIDSSVQEVVGLSDDVTTNTEQANSLSQQIRQSTLKLLDLVQRFKT